MAIFNTQIKGSAAPVIDTLNVSPSTSAQTIRAPQGTDGYSPVNVSAVTAGIDQNIQAGNIKDGVTILGVTGNYQGGITPTGTINITTNGTHNVTNYANAEVQVPSSAPTYYIKLDNDGNNTLVKTAPVISIPTGSTINSLGERCLYYAYANATLPANTDVDLSGLTTINAYGLSYTFQNVTGLRNVNLGGLTSLIGTNPLNYAFSGSSIESLDMHSFNPVNSTQTVAYMCRNCTNLTNVNLSSATALYGNNPFQGCTSLSTVSFSNNFNVSISSMFSGNTALSTINGTITGVSSGNNAFSGCTGLTNLNFFKPTSITNAQYMFQGCTGITSVDLSDLTTITGTKTCQYMFMGCTNLVSADLSSLQSISGGSSTNAGAAYMFQNCTSLTTVDLSNLSNTNTYGCSDMFNGCSSLRTIICDKTKSKNWGMLGMFRNSGIVDVSQILGEMTSINGYYGLQTAFYNCPNITTLDLSKVTEITGTSCISDAFSYCTGITSIDFSNLKKIRNSSNNTGTNMFYGCTGLTSVTFDSLDDLGGRALSQWFLSCTNLTSLSFPALKSTSFDNAGGATNQFNAMLGSVVGCTVHFPSNMQSVIGSWTDVINGFSGTNTTVLFDLPATE